MATTTPSDFKIYTEWVQSGYIEKLAQNVDGFNSNSNNAINLTTAMLVGNYKEKAFFEELAQSDLVSLFSICLRLYSASSFLEVRRFFATLIH